MSQEDIVVEALVGKFAYLEGRVKIQHARRIFLEVEYKNFREVFAFAVKELKFGHFCAITGLDELDRLGFIYHFAQDSGILLNLKTSVLKENPVLETVIPYFPGAEIYEREVVDLLGAKVEGLPAGNRYPLTDEWPA
ncbi:MAG: NADH-quinone oxidoreductase subunit C, partial [Candidatus Omnitrophica bacterium]|nr:NADH-quinone oxidoreductase subunit C [Candidatus Omnitrophota bacterium]